MVQAIKTRIAVRVRPRAKRTALTGMLGAAFKLSVAATPTDGKANQACVRYLAELIGVPRSAVRIVAGETSTSKVFEFDGLTADQLKRKLDSAI